VSAVVAVGDCGIDRYLNLKADRAGGIALNFAVNAQATFPPHTDITVVSALGTDAEAETVLEAVTDQNLVRCLPVRAGRTSLQVIDREANGEKIFVRYEAGVLTDYRIDKPAAAAIAASDVVIYACYRQVMAFFTSALHVDSPGIRAVDFLDLSGFPDRLAPVEQTFDQFDVGFAGLDRADGGIIDGLESLARRHGKLFVVTLGAHGSEALGGPDRMAVEAVAVNDVVDTTGAGDSFAAGFLGAFSRHRDVAFSLVAGARQAALTVRRFGAFDAELKPWSDGKEPA
jgi:sugar/nucleoside kinase (ribokinase family)